MESSGLKNAAQQKTEWMKWLGLVVLVMAQIGTSSDNSVLSVATFSLLSTLHASMADIQLANVIYSLCAGCLMIVGGMLGLIIGWKRNFRIGAFLCVLGEMLVATSGSIEVFTWGGRLSVGLGASLMIPSVLGLIPGLFQGKDRAVAFGAIGAATGIATCAGPIAAGYLIDTFDWRVAFGFMAVYFAIVLAGSYFIGHVPKPAQKVRFDAVGSLVAIAGLFMLIIGISKVPVWGLWSPIDPPVLGGQVFTLFGASPALPIALLGFLTLVVLVPIEQRIEQQYGSCLIPSSFLRTAQVRNGLYLTAMLFLCFGGAFFLIITYLQLVAGFSAVATGVAMAAMAVPLIGFSMGIPKYYPQGSPKTICRWGVLLSAISAVPMALSLQNDAVGPLMYLGLFFFGAGQGFVASQSANVIAMAVNNRDAQQASGIQAATRNVGQAIGVAILGVIMLYSMTGNVQGALASQTVLSARTKQVVASQTSVGFLSDTQFQAYFQGKVSDPAERAALLEINREARKASTRRSLIVLGLMTGAFYFGTSSLPSKSAK